MRTKLKIPCKADWNSYEDDLDVQYLHNLFLGKDIDEVQQYFEAGRSIERADELLFSPRPIFQYYIFAFSQFLLSDKGKEDSDAASAFLNLLVAREEKDPSSVMAIYSDLSQTIEFIETYQIHSDADIAIYGLFSERTKQLKKLCNFDK